jgi:phosphatidylserine decarboxylase
MFEKNRIRFADDIVANMSSFGVESIFSQGFGRPMVETDVKVRSLIGSITSCTQEENSHVQ